MKVFLAVAAALVLAAVLAALVIGRGHGPGRHQAYAPASTVVLPAPAPPAAGGVG